MRFIIPSGQSCPGDLSGWGALTSVALVGRPTNRGTRLRAVRQQGLDTGVKLLLESSEAGPDASEAIAELAGQVVAQRTTSLEEGYLALLAAA